MQHRFLKKFRGIFRDGGIWCQITLVGLLGDCGLAAPQHPLQIQGAVMPPENPQGRSNAPPAPSLVVLKKATVFFLLSIHPLGTRPS